MNIWATNMPLPFVPHAIWSSTGGKFEFYLAISRWPDAADLEDFQQLLVLMERAMKRNVAKNASRFTGFDDVEIAADTLRQPESE